MFDAGLPDITGTLTGYAVSKYYTGAFSSEGTITSFGSSGNDFCKINFTASKCSSVYGKSNTVQPPAVTVLYIIKY